MFISGLLVGGGLGLLFGALVAVVLYEARAAIRPRAE